MLHPCQPNTTHDTIIKWIGLGLSHLVEYPYLDMTRPDTLTRIDTPNWKFKEFNNYIIRKLCIFHLVFGKVIKSTPDRTV